jgi:succinate dehydrogenase / fumarate reductase cytochrome b subunit
MEITNRPLSPHLQIYRPQITAVLSITHRATGVFLAIGTLLLVYWLFSLARGPEAYAGAQALLGSWIGQIALFAWTLAFFYHLCNGIRHLFWDMGRGFDIRNLYASGTAVVVVSIGLTLVTWIAAYALRG